MAMVTPDLLKALNTVFQKNFQDGLAKAESTYTEIATVINSTTASNTYGWLGQFPKLREWVGSRVLKDMATHGYTITNKKYEGTVSVSRTDIEDDNLGIYQPIIEEMGYAAGVYPDELIYALLALGRSSLCFDGQSFFDTDHPVYPEVDGTGTATTISNLFTPSSGSDNTPWYLLDTSRALKPLIWQKRTAPEMTSMIDGKDEEVFMRDVYRYGIRARGEAGFGFWQMAACSTEELNAENFEKVYDAMRNQKADGGRPLNIKPTLLVVPTTLRAAAKRIVGQEMINGSNNPNYNLVKIHETPWLN